MFSDIASTDVVADILVLQRRMPGEYASAEEIDSWVPTEVLNGTDGKPMRMYPSRDWERHQVNRYWTTNPQSVLGYWEIQSSRHGEKAFVTIPEIGEVFTKLNDAVEAVQPGAYVPYESDSVEVALHASNDDYNHMLPGSFVLVDGEVHRTTGHNIYKTANVPSTRPSRRRPHRYSRHGSRPAG